MDIKEIFGANLAAFRAAAKLSQDELAERVGLKSGVSISRMENGNKFVSDKTLGKIARVLEKDPSEFFVTPGYQPKPTPEEALQILAEAIRKPVRLPTPLEEKPEILRLIEGRSAKEISSLTRLVKDWIADEDEMSLSKPTSKKNIR